MKSNRLIIYSMKIVCGVKIVRCVVWAVLAGACVGGCSKPAPTTPGGQANTSSDPAETDRAETSKLPDLKDLDENRGSSAPREGDSASSTDTPNSSDGGGGNRFGGNRNPVPSGGASVGDQSSGNSLDQIASDAGFEKTQKTAASVGRVFEGALGGNSDETSSKPAPLRSLANALGKAVIGAVQEQGQERQEETSNSKSEKSESPNPK